MGVCFRVWRKPLTTLNSRLFSLINENGKLYLFHSVAGKVEKLYVKNIMEIIKYYVHVKCIYSCCSILIDLSRSGQIVFFFPQSMFANHPNPK